MPASQTHSNLKNVTYRLITSGKELESALRWRSLSEGESLKQSSVVGLDCETTGLDPHIHTIRLIQLAVPKLLQGYSPQVLATLALVPAHENGRLC